MGTGFTIAGIAIVVIHVIGVFLYNRGKRKKVHQLECTGICIMALTTIATFIFGSCVKNMS